MKYKSIMTFFCVSLPICILLRTLQLVFTIDGKTGFVKQGFEEISFAITVIIFIVIAASSAFGAFVKKIKRRECKINPFMSVVSISLAVVTIVEAAVVELGGGLTNIMSSVLLLLGAVTAGVFLLYGIQAMGAFKLPGFVYIIPIAYWVLKLVFVFSRISSLALISDNVFLMFSYCAMLVFMLEFGKDEIGMYKDGIHKGLLISSIAACMLSFVISVPSLIALAIGTLEVLHENIYALFTALFSGLFLFVYILSCFAAQKRVKGTHLDSNSVRKFNWDTDEE